MLSATQAFRQRASEHEQTVTAETKTLFLSSHPHPTQLFLLNLKECVKGTHIISGTNNNQLMMAFKTHSGDFFSPPKHLGLFIMS